MIITKEQAKDIVFEGGYDWDESKDEFKYKTVSEGNWVDDGKNSYATFIFKAKETGKYFRLNMGRGGSYHTDYYYDWEYMDEFDCTEVEKVIVEVKSWKAVEEK